MFSENNILQEIMIAWSKTTAIKHDVLENIEKQIIWNNKYVQIQSKTYIKHGWIKE